MLTTTVTLGNVITCGQCGICFAFDARVHQERRENGDNFYCPNGHSRVYRKSKVQQLEEKLAAAEQRTEKARAQTRRERERAEHEKRRHAATKGVLTKTRKRVSAGVCPCCRRSFENLREHMETKHPDYGTDQWEPPR